MYANSADEMSMYSRIIIIMMIEKDDISSINDRKKTASDFLVHDVMILKTNLEQV
jgi:hypothetical protein